MKNIAILTNETIGLVTGEPSFGGGQRLILTLARLLRDHDFDVHLYQHAWANSGTDPGEYFGFPVYPLQTGSRFSEFEDGICTEFTRRTKSYDHVIHGLMEYSSGAMRPDALAIVHGIWFDQPNIKGYHFRTTEWYAHLERALTNPKRIISVDTNSINVVRALFPGLDRKMTYLPNFVDTDVFHPRETVHQYRVLFPRRVHTLRGAELMPDILKHITGDCSIWWVGGDLSCQDPRLKCFTVPFDEMPNIYNQSNIVVIPTIGAEGTSLSCLEALASGCVVVSTHVGGLANIIMDGYNGRLVEPNAKEIAAAVNDVMENRTAYDLYRYEGLRTAGRFSLTRWKERWVNVLNEEGWI